MVANRILLADDHAIVRQGLKALLEREGFAVVAEADDGQAAVRLARERCPDVAVLDFSMPILNGLDAALEILRACPRAKAILLTMHTDDHYVLSALQAGVKGYVVKTEERREGEEGISQVLRGQIKKRHGVSETGGEANLAKSEIARDPVKTHESE